MPNSVRPTDEDTASAAPTATAPIASPVELGTAPRTDRVADDVPAGSRSRASTLPLVTLVLGIAGVALGVVVIWYIAAIALGLVAVIVGVVALRRTRGDADPKERPRAPLA